MAWKWFAIKTVVRAVITGKPEQTDKYFHEDTSFYEENVFVVKAQSDQHAYELAERAVKKQQVAYINIYGQKVEYIYIDSVDCFELYDDPSKSGSEVFSVIYAVPKVKTDTQFLQERYDYFLKDEDANDERNDWQHKKQKVLLNCEFSGLDEDS
ncbi:hypothetical protein FACS1894211_01390 [Clostridia bacterium]|nr:hypothetical protein FACS1894211_01390 [Clostridia bacterium]